MTSSLDGHIGFWDTKGAKNVKHLDLVWKPFLRVPLSAADNSFDYGLLGVSLRPPNGLKPDGAVKDKEKEKGGDSGKEPWISSKFFASTEVVIMHFGIILLVY